MSDMKSFFRLSPILLVLSLLSTFPVNAAMHERKPMKDSSLWEKKPIPPHGENFEILVVLDDGSEWVSMMPDQLKNVGNNRRKVCIEGRFNRMINKNGKFVVLIVGTDREFILRNKSLSNGLAGNDHIIMCGVVSTYPPGQGKGCYLAVSKIERLKTPAMSRYQSEYRVYNETKNWQAIVDLIKRISFQARTDSLNKNRFERFVKNTLWGRMLFLKATDEQTTNPNNPDDMYKRALEFLDHVNSDIYPRKLVMRGLQLNPDHVGCRQLQPQVWPRGRLWEDFDVKPPVRVWVDVDEYKRLAEEKELRIEKNKALVEKRRKEHQDFLLKREKERQRIIYDTLTKWKGDPKDVAVVTKQIIHDYFLNEKEDDELLLKDLLTTALMKADDDIAITVLSAAAQHSIVTIRRDGIEGLVWLNSDASLNAMLHAIKAAKLDFKPSLVEFSIKALQQHPTFASLKTLIVMSRDADNVLLAKKAISTLQELTDKNYNTPDAWEKWLQDQRASGQLDVLQPYFY